MSIPEIRKTLARFFALGALGCGIVALALTFVEHVWKLGFMGWFMGGALLALLAIFLLLDEYTEC